MRFGVILIYRHLCANSSLTIIISHNINGTDIYLLNNSYVLPNATLLLLLIIIITKCTITY